ncbi:MAG TPA: CopG family transcriptional regulator [Chthoniobacterales bacterium]|jgi:hypothetical protein|nr:CopG family transcriptional regulator [Chthoniobacterales bacterium]
MRTTLTLDEDVAVLLEKARRAKGLSFKQIVNEALRVGLSEVSTPGHRRHRFKTRHADLGRCLIGSFDDVSEALAASEGEAFQ